MIRFYAIHFALFLLFLLFLHAPAFSQCPKLVWSDEFDGTSLDLNKWSFQIGNGCDLGSCGWGNNELQYYTDKNVSVSEGNLSITAHREKIGTNEYSSSRVRSIHKGDFLYGRMEARMKLPVGKGIWPAFWMMPTDEVYGAWPKSGEVDIMEYRGSETNVNHGTIHYGGLSPDNKNSTGNYELPNGQLSEDFHVYAIEWEPNQIRWYIDGILYSVETDKDIVEPYKWPFDQKFYLLLNVAVGGNYDGSPDASTAFPQSLVVDYVRVYDTGIPYINGPELVQTQTEVSYTVAAMQGASYSWSVPAGAMIVAGQGTNSVQVQWGDYQGQVKVMIAQACGTSEHAKSVYTKPLQHDLTFQNFDDQRNLTFRRADGTYESFIANPLPTAVNRSPLAGKYTRNSAAQYDVLSYGVSQIIDASEYTAGKKKLFLDILTAAPVNTPIIIYLNNSAMSAGQPHPIGRHSCYIARTTRQNEWERLEFKLEAILDASVPNNSIDSYVMLFASGTYTGHAYFIDNLDSYSVGTPASGDGSDQQSPKAPAKLALTGKTENSTSFSWDAATDNVAVTGYDIIRNGTLAGSTTSTSITDAGLAAGTTYSYAVKARDAAGNVSAASNTVSVTTDASIDNLFIKVEAELYSAMRKVDVQNCADVGGGLNVASIDSRDFMEYNVTIPATGTYQLEFRVASTVATGSFDLKQGNVTLTSIAVPNTGSGQAWATVSREVRLTAGTHTLKVVGTGGAFSLNWFSFTGTSASGSSTAAFKEAGAPVTSLPLLSVYPNPASGKINIRSNNHSLIEVVEMVSVTGGIVRSLQPQKEHVVLPLAGIPKGLYFLRIKQGDQVTTRKVVVK